MKVALMMENSQAAKNPVILNELTSGHNGGHFT